VIIATDPGGDTVCEARDERVDPRTRAALVFRAMPVTGPCALRSPVLLTPLLALVAGGLFACGSEGPLDQVRDLQAEARFEETLEPLRVMIEERPEDAEVQYLYGHALVATQQLSLAQFALRKAMLDPEWLVPAGLELAQTSILTNNAEEAIDVTDRILDAQGDHLDALLLRSRALVMVRHRYAEALADADRVLGIDPGNVEGMMLRAVSLLGLERIEDANAAIQELDSTARIAELSPSDAARFCAMRAVFAKEKGEIELAEDTFAECLEAFPAEWIVVQEALEFFDARGEAEREIEILRKALAEQPAAGVYRRTLSEKLRREGEVAEAERILREGTEMAHPVLAAESWVDLANHYHARGDYPAAADALGRAVEIHATEDPQLTFDYADALVMAGRNEEALEIAKGISVAPFRALVAGRVALEQDRPVEAQSFFAEALRLWPDNAVARYYSAVAAEEVGEIDRAIAEYRYSLRADPRATDVRVRLARLHLAEGAPDLALTMLRHDGSRNPAGLEGTLLDLHAVARLGRSEEVRKRLGNTPPALLGRSVAAAADGLRERLGPAAAAQLVRSVPRLDLGEPENSDALSGLVADLIRTGKAGEALELAQAAVAKHPDAASSHAILGAALEGMAAPSGEVHASYARSLELDPASAAALSGLGRLAEAAGDPSAALAFYQRAAAADLADASALRSAAEILASMGRADEAVGQLEEALERSPYDGGVALLLAELMIERDGERGLQLAQRALRFGGGPAAEALVERAQGQSAGSVASERSAPAGPDSR
jgi:tetratricopeptide (TPR) repeat protein